MVASVLVAAMPPVSCLSYRHDHREDEDGAPGANERDGDQCVDGHSEPYSSRQYRAAAAAAGALRAVISRCLPSSSPMTANGSMQSPTSHLASRSAGITAGSRGDRPPAVTRSQAVEGMAAPEPLRSYTLRDELK